MSETRKNPTITEELSQDLLAAAELLAKYGIGLTIDNNYHGIKPSQVLTYLTEPDHLYAELQGVSLELYFLFNAFLKNDCICQGKTKRGEPCQNRTYLSSGNPRDFTPGVSDRCWLHGGPKRGGA